MADANDTPKVIDTGGPAFPVLTGLNSSLNEYNRVDYYAETSAGMTLRDYFAAKAMVLFTGKTGYRGLHTASQKHGITLPEALSVGCYEIADAMIAERGRQS